MKLTHVLAAAILAVGFTAAMPGCSSEKAYIPGNAPLVASGTGTTSYTAADSGTVYIFDKTWNKIVYSGDVKAGQNVKVDTLAGKILVDGVPRVEQANVGGGSTFEFYLHPSARTTVIEHKTVIEHNNPME